MKNRTTIRDVAKYLGVSVATISNVLNDINKTSEETRERVLQAVKELDYQPDFTARSLAKRKSNLIGVMLPYIEENTDTSFLSRDNFFYGEFIGGIEHGTKLRGYDYLITGTKSGQSCKEWIKKRNLDGIIIMGIYPEALFNEFKKMNIPVVLIDTYEKYTGRFHNIAIDDKSGGMTAANHLISLGHKRIALATGSINTSDVNFMRYEGYKKALQDSNITFDEKLIYEDEVSFAGGYRIGEEILKRNSDITAVFAVADILALGIMKSFVKNGKSIPDDLSIVGFDNLKMCEFVTPGLTTISQNIFKKGVIAADTLLDDIESGVSTKERITLPIKLVVRESTKSI
ncbi:MAG: LacI family transcriptional regulator [Clostridia bacterium]|nr:LacI family transcriptional regulator [Clostridia bacterium]